MSGKARLEGTVADKARACLKEITGLLERYGVRYCLDGGTLLGIVREGRLLPWDSDMDLFVPSTEIPKLRKCILPLWLRGYKLRLTRVTEDYGPMPKDGLRILKARTRKRLVSRGDVLLDIFVKYADDEKYYWSVIGKGKTIYKSVPRHFYDNLATIDFDGKSYPIPEDIDGYLTCRYGDWKVPVEEWDYTKDDNAVM
jgi:phosphorylcholine metabolism protein LicD